MRAHRHQQFVHGRFAARMEYQAIGNSFNRRHPVAAIAELRRRASLPTEATTKRERVVRANNFLTAIASCGRRFFRYEAGVSYFELDARGRVWFIDTYRGARIYTHHTRDSWRGFTQGGTLRNLVIALRDFIRTGDGSRVSIGPWPDWVCDGDLWGYGFENMERVREAARAQGIVRGAP